MNHCFMYTSYIKWGINIALRLNNILLWARHKFPLPSLLSPLKALMSAIWAALIYAFIFA